MTEFEQGSTEWFNWRKKGIGASDMPIILGMSPFKTPYQLWLEKTDQVDKSGEQAMIAFRGTNMESVAREHYELETGIKMQPITFQMEQPEYMRASLDGWNADRRIVLEVKCPGKENHQMAVKGEVPKYYWWQMQHQLLVARGTMAHYWSFDGEDGVLIEVLPDPTAQKTILDAARGFWELVLNKKPPAMTEKDWMPVNDKDATALVNLYRDLKDRADAIEAQMKEVKADILEFCHHPNTIIDGMKVQTITTAGRVNYDAIPELAGVDLDQYRGKGFTTMRFTDTTKKRERKAKNAN